MTTNQMEQLNQIRNFETGATSTWVTYWLHYSHMGTWQFWFIVALLIGPLVALYYLMDRRKALLLGFYGFAVHMLFSYIDLFGTKNGLWEYPYKAFPVVPVNVALDTSFVPVVYMLMYQWALNRNVNYYVVLTGVSIVFAGVIKPIFTVLNLFQMYNGMNYFYLFIGYLLIMLVSKWLTNVFIWLQRTESAVAK